MSSLQLTEDPDRVRSFGGYNSESDVAFRDSQRKLVEEAHAEYLDRLTNAWKGNRSTDA